MVRVGVTSGGCTCEPTGRWGGDGLRAEKGVSSVWGRFSTTKAASRTFWKDVVLWNLDRLGSLRNFRRDKLFRRKFSPGVK